MDMRNYLLQLIISVPAVLLAFTAQGYARAKVADMLGDKTPRFRGRLTFNPLAHIDPMGFLMILIVGFGWTKPVETNPNAYKRGYKDAIKVTVAAPLANLLIGFIFSFIFALWFILVYKLFPATVINTTVYNVGGLMIQAVATINIQLFIFNLLPLPGLAGFEIMRELWPKTFYKVADSIYQYQMFILIGIVVFGSKLLMIPSVLIINLFSKIAFAILGIFF